MKIVKFEIERKFELDKDRIIDKCLKFNANWYRNKIINNLEKKMDQAVWLLIDNQKCR